MPGNAQGNDIARLAYNEEEVKLVQEAEGMEKSAAELRERANRLHLTREKAAPLIDRLCFAATERCACGLGFAYDPAGEVRSGKDSPFVMVSQWECSGVLLGTGDRSVTHSAPLPFNMYEVKSEDQPSQNGRTTRPQIAA